MVKVTRLFSSLRKLRTLEPVEFFVGYDEFFA